MGITDIYNDMTRMFRLALFAFVVVPVGVTVLHMPAAAEDPPDVSDEQILEIYRMYDSDNAPGCALGIYDQGELIYSRGFGLANLDYGIPISDSTSFYMASISKQVTATAAALLSVRGELELEEPVSLYLDDWPEWADKVEVRHLFDHTSGLPDLYDLMNLSGISLSDVMDLEDYYGIIKGGERLLFEPGLNESYTNSAYTVLALLIERISGERFSQFVDRELLQPLGMKRTHFHDDRARIIKNRAISYAPREDGFRRTYLGNFQGVGPGGLYSTLADWARWEAFWADRAELNTDGGINESEADRIREMMTRPATVDGDEIQYGMGLEIEMEKGVRVNGHSGRFMGFRTDVRRYPDHGLAFLTLCNREDAEPRELHRSLANHFLREPFEAYLEPFEGEYVNRDLPATFRFEVRDGELYLERRLSPSGPLGEGDREDRWEAGSWQIDFQRGNNGEVTGFSIRTSRNRDVRFTRDRSYGSDS